MLPWKKILCPTDFSEPSFRSLEVANEIALHFGSELILVHTIRPVPVLAGTDPAAGVAASGFDVGDYQERMKILAEEMLAREASERITEDVVSRTEVLRGKPAEEIVAFAEQDGVDAIVIATHGRSGWRRFVFGSVAEKVVRFATCPVLTIQAHEDDG
jgi:nucleotide-binding universal stress UspA family protein